MIDTYDVHVALCPSLPVATTTTAWEPAPSVSAAWPSNVQVTGPLLPEAHAPAVPPLAATPHAFAGAVNVAGAPDVPTHATVGGGATGRRPMKRVAVPRPESRPSSAGSKSTVPPGVTEKRTQLFEAGTQTT